MREETTKAADMDLPAVSWLKTVDALLAEANASPQLTIAKDDLLECQRVLQEAKKHGVRWRLAIDF